jgi:diacylglycerol kinase family enzyme
MKQLSIGPRTVNHASDTSPNSSLPNNVVLLVNTLSGKCLESRDRLDRALQRDGLHVVEEVDMRDAERLRKWTSSPQPERPMIAAAGGDGTVGTVAGFVANTGTVLGILPLGTHNDTARSLGIPRDLESAVRLLSTGKVSTVDAARFVPDEGEPRYFVQAAALGIQVAFARLATNVSVRRRLRRFTYLAATALALRDRRPFTCDLLVDGRRTTLCLLYLSVLNAPIFGGPLSLRLEGGSIDNRRLDVLTFEDMPLSRLLLAMVPMLVGRTPRMRGVQLYRVPHVRVEAPRPIEVTLDGELAGCVPGDFVLASEALCVVTPHAFEDIDDEVPLDAAKTGERNLVSINR